MMSFIAGNTVLKTDCSQWNFYRWINPSRLTFFPASLIQNLGRHDQSIELENLMMDNQNGEIEIADLKWAKK